MAPRLPSGTYKIVSLLDGNAPASVNRARITFQSVRLGEQVTDWSVQERGDDVYQLSIGEYPFTGVVDGEVTATMNPKDNVLWIAIYRELQEAYTIQPVRINDEAKGWTAPVLGEENPAIKIKLLITTMSEPPRFLPTQLFKFIPANE